MPNNALHNKLRNYTGIIGITILVLAIFITALTYVGSAGEHYSPFNHYISELGEVGISQFALIFNAGMIISGILLTVFLYTSFSQLFKDRIRRTMQTLGVTVGFSTILVGIFSMQIVPTHEIVAGLLFLSIFLSSVIFVVFALRNRLGIARRTILSGVFVTLSTLSFALIIILTRSTLYSSWLSRPDFGR